MGKLKARGRETERDRERQRDRGKERQRQGERLGKTGSDLVSIFITGFKISQAISLHKVFSYMKKYIIKIEPA